MSAEPVATLTEPGEPYEHRGRYSKRTVQINRRWIVQADGETIGFIRYTLITHERRTPGKMYVNSRWQSPGWQWLPGTDPLRARWFTGDTKKYCIEHLVREASRCCDYPSLTRKESQ